MKKKTNKMTGAQRLQYRKELLKGRICEQQKKLDSHFSYIQQNMGSVLLGITVAAFSRKLPLEFRSLISLFSNKEGEQNTSGIKTGKTMQMVKSLLPVLIEIALPFLLSAGVKTLKKKFFNKKI